MPRRFACASSDSCCEETAAELLEAGSSALEAVVASYFAVAAERAGVLLAPASLVVGRSASDVWVFDGRSRQPGLSTKRPRGFVEGEPIADAAYVAVPRAAQVLLVALAHQGAVRLSRVFRSALARLPGESRRRRLFERAASVGARAFTEPGFLRPMLASAGVVPGGLLCDGDFQLDPASVEVRATTLETSADSGESSFVAPWFRAGPSSVGVGALAVDSTSGVAPCQVGSGQTQRHYVLAGDGRAQLVALEFDVAAEGVRIEGLDLLAPRLARPVMRGVSRVPPGSVIRFDSSAVHSCRVRGEAVGVAIPEASVELARDPATREISVLGG